MPRRIVADEEGFVYFARSPSGYLYGPYGNRGTAAGVATSESRYVPERQPRIYRYPEGYIDNPNYDPEATYSVVKAKLGPFEDAPKLSLRDKYQNALDKLARIEKMLADRGIDIEVG